MNKNLHSITHIFCVSILFIFTSSVTKAQEMNDELKKKLRQSLLNSEMEPSQQMYQPNHRRFQQEDEILRVSPTTKLPTKLDRFLNMGKMKEEEEEEVNSNVFKAQPMNIRPRGSVRYEFNGNRMHIRSNAGEVVKPSGHDFDPVRAIQRYKAKKRQQKVDKIMKAYEME